MVPSTRIREFRPRNFEEVEDDEDKCGYADLGNSLYLTKITESERNTGPIMYAAYNHFSSPGLNNATSDTYNLDLTLWFRTAFPPKERKTS